MTTRATNAGRTIQKRKVVAASLAFGCAALLVTTDFAQGVAASARESVALAELAARSPGMRIGGVALKGKARRAPAFARRPDSSTPGKEPRASVLGTAVGPEGAAPSWLPAGTVGLPDSIVTPAVQDLPLPASPGSQGGGFAAPPFGGGVIVGGGGGGGGGSGGTPPTSEVPGGETVIPPVIVPPIAAVPEPGTWLMLIAGFGLMGAAMRRRKQLLPA